MSWIVSRTRLFWSTIALILFFTAACTPSSPARPVTPAERTEASSPRPTPIRTGTAAPFPSPSPAPTQTPAPALPEDILSKVGYNLPLTIQHVTETGAMLFFDLDTPSEGFLLYWPSGEEDRPSSLPLAPTEKRHQVTIDGLSPGTEYQAVVGLNPGSNLYGQPHFRGKKWGTVRFHTASDKQPLRVAVFGDSGLGQQSTLELAERMASHDPDLIVHTGDVVYLMRQNRDPFEAYALKYYTTLAPILHTAPLYPVVGNHDIEAGTLWRGTHFYFYAFPAFSVPGFPDSEYEGENQWYAVAYGRVQFLMLNTQTLFGEGGQAEQDAWLAERLADERYDFTIPVFHVPPYSSGPHAPEGPTVSQAWGTLLENARVPVVFSGHEHFYERLAVGGITYIVSGGGCATLYDPVDPHPESQSFAKRMHFVLMEVYADRIELEAIALDGESLDQVTIPLE